MKTLQVTTDVINIINNALENNDKKLLKSARNAMPRDEFFVSNETVDLFEALENLIINAEIKVTK